MYVNILVIYIKIKLLKRSFNMIFYFIHVLTKFQGIVKKIYVLINFN
jgi:hypothetical protein